MVPRKTVMQRKSQLLGSLGLGVAIALSNLPAQAATPPLQPVLELEQANESALSSRPGWDDRLWGEGGQTSDRAALLSAIDYSLRYLQSPSAAEAYRNYPVSGVTRARVRRSLERFRQLVQSCRSAAELQQAVQREFVFYRAIGHDGQGTVAFTGYFEPTYRASRVPTSEYRYPLYRLPPDLARWPQPHPTRAELEGADGLQGARGRLRGLELVWLRDRLEAFLVQVQGSARLQLTDGGTMTVGYAGRTDYPYTGVGRELVQAGIFTLEELTLPRLIDYFQAHPDELDVYLPRNQRFVFFEETHGAPPTGSLGVPVTPERSIATDKSLMPPGAIALIHMPLPSRNGQTWELRPTSRYVLDQDTGGAIRGPGRVDLFMGTGSEAGDRAGLVNSTGQLYYLLLKDS